MVELNSNPEILLKKRRNAERTRIAKQEKAREQEQDRKRKSAQRKQRFIRAETLVVQNLATKREQERIKRVSKVERLNANQAIEKIANDGSKTKTNYSGEPTLYFIVRVPGPHGVKIPSKAFKVLTLLRLTQTNTGVFIKLTETIYPLLKLISPYAVIGRPSLQSVRQLIQKRGTTTVNTEEGKSTTVKLNDNQLVEDRLGDEGIICIEDIIHEIVLLGENFKKVNSFLNPFKLSNDIVGFGALAKLHKIEKREAKKEKKASNAGDAPLLEIDMDDFIAQQN